MKQNQFNQLLVFKESCKEQFFIFSLQVKGVVKPINILVAIFSEKESHAVFLLSKIGVSRLDIVSYISHGSSSSKGRSSIIKQNEEAKSSARGPQN